MSQENVEIVRKGIAAFIESERLSEFFAPDVVWDMSTFSGWPGQSEFCGLDEFNDFLDAWIEPYEGWSYEVEKILDAGGSRVVATVHQRGKPRGSDAWIDAYFAIVYTIEGELIQRAQVYANADEALEAAGLPEQAMVQENVEIVGRAHERLNEGDIDGLIALCDDDFELDMSARTLNPAIFRGHEGIRRFYREVSEVWEEFRWEPLRFSEAADKVVVLLHSHGRGRGSGLEMARDAAMVWTVRERRAVSVRFYTDQAAALEAAGLSE